MKNLYLCLMASLILSACEMFNNTNTYLDETQSVQISKEPSTSTPQATSTVLIKETQTPNTATLIPTVEMNIYKDEELEIQIGYPVGWVEKPERTFIGDDGFLIIKKIDAYHSPNLGHVAVDFANTYYPQFAVYCAGSGVIGCAMDERKFVDMEIVAAIIPYRWNSERADYFSIETTRRYYPQIANSIIWEENAFEPTPTEYPTPSPNPKEIIFDSASLVEMPNYREDTINSPLIEIGGNNCGATNKKDKFQLITENYGRMQIKSDEKTIYYYSSWGFADSPPWTFCQWDESWILETHEIVIINGVNFNQVTGYDEIFGWHLLQEKTAFFVKIGNKYYVSIDKNILPIEYEEISHYGCCEIGHATNPRTNGAETLFRAKRNGVWYTVLITVK